MAEYENREAVVFFADYREPYDKVHGWLEGYAADHLSTEEAMSRLAKRMEDYYEKQYDSIERKATNNLQRFFLRYPEPDWSEVTRYFEEDYIDILHDRDASARAGGLVSPDYYEEMLNVMPPRAVPRKLLDSYGCSEGFLMGEPYGTDAQGRSTYMAYGRRPDGRCLYLGLSPEAGGPTVSNQRRPAKPSKTSSASRRKVPAKGAPGRTAARPRKPKTKGGRA